MILVCITDVVLLAMCTYLYLTLQCSIKCICTYNCCVYVAVGYLQGYNDILARFLVVLDSEVDCYWMFGLFVQKREKDFSEEGMIHKIGQSFYTGQQY